jgi:hypothetical protein
MSGSDKLEDRPPTASLPLTRYTHEFASDWVSALRDAHVANDSDGESAITQLLFDFFERELSTSDERQLVEFLESHRVWRDFKAWPIFKTTDVPCLAFTASISGESQNVILVALGCCYRYPEDDEEKWWRDVILPRVRRL